MKPHFLLPFILFAALDNSIETYAQVKHTSVPLGDTLSKALEKNSLLAAPTRAFHILLNVSEPENPQSPYQGTIEEWWVSPEQWRRVVTAKGGMRQTIVVSQGQKTEKDEGDYYPLWLRDFETALVDPVPDAQELAASGATIDQTFLPNGMGTDPCVRSRAKVGTGNRATDTFSNLCFDETGKLKFYGSPRYGMEFLEYKGFGKKQIARKLVHDPEPGTKLIGIVSVLEDEAKFKPADDVFTPLSQDDNRFKTVPTDSARLETLTAGIPPLVWPTIRGGNPRGHIAIYISVDSAGKVREAWPLNSDNGDLQDFARDQARQWQIKPPLDAEGHPVQIDGPLGLVFETTISDPTPHLTEVEVRALATKIVEPDWPSGRIKPGQTLQVEISVNEQGKVVGASFPHTPAAAVSGLNAVNEAIHKWTFHPLIRNGKPEFFKGTVIFTVH